MRPIKVANASQPYQSTVDEARDSGKARVVRVTETIENHVISQLKHGVRVPPAEDSVIDDDVTWVIAL